MQTLGSTSVPALLKYLRHAERLGLDIAPALAAAGLQADQLNDNRQRLPGEAHERLLGFLRAFRRSPVRPAFGAFRPARLLERARLHRDELRHPGRGHEPHHALREAGRRQGTSRIEAAGGQVRLIWNCRHQTPLVRRHMVEHVLASWVPTRAGSPTWKVRRTRSGWNTTCRTEPAWKTTRPSSAVRYASPNPCSALLVPLDYLALPLRQADATLLRTLEEHALALMAELDDDEPLPLRVKNALRQLLKDGLPRKERVAEKFGMTVRTLQRHLQQAGSSYQQTLDELRRELAEHYLLHSELPIRDIAQYLGFTESRSFHRSFRVGPGRRPASTGNGAASRRRIENGGHPAAVGLNRAVRSAE